MNTTDSKQMLQIGATLQNGKYRINRYLASGGFGNTYIATNTALDSDIVIKEFYIKGITARDSNGTSVSVSIADNREMWEKMLERFKREAKHMHKINHPNIVRVHDLFDENDTAYYVMDLVNGTSLREKAAKAGGRLGEGQVMRHILPQVLNALERIHGDNIWHLDLKPANLMEEQDGTIKIIDFGASKQSDSRSGGVTTTALAYTPGYAAPEQMLQLTKAIGGWTDIYALGATLYNLLTGKTPPTQVDIDDLGTKAFDFSDTTVSQPTRDLIIAMMNTKRKERPQSIAQVRALIDNPNALNQPNLSSDDEVTVLSPTSRVIDNPKNDKEKKQIVSPISGKTKTVATIIAIVIATLLITFGILRSGGCSERESLPESSNATSVTIPESSKSENVSVSEESTESTKPEMVTPAVTTPTKTTPAKKTPAKTTPAKKAETKKSEGNHEVNKPRNNEDTKTGTTTDRKSINTIIENSKKDNRSIRDM